MHFLLLIHQLVFDWTLLFGKTTSVGVWLDFDYWWYIIILFRLEESLLFRIRVGLLLSKWQEKLKIYKTSSHKKHILILFIFYITILLYISLSTDISLKIQHPLWVQSCFCFLFLSKVMLWGPVLIIDTLWFHQS